MNPFWLGAIIRSTLRLRRAKDQPGSMPRARDLARQEPRTELRSISGFLRGIWKGVRGKRGTQRGAVSQGEKE